MKRITVIFILPVYLAFAIGISLSTHYCGDSVTSVVVGLNHDHKCPCGTNSMKADCCKDERTFIHLDEYQIKTANTEPLLAISFSLPASLHHPIALTAAGFQLKADRFDPPERTNCSSVYLQNRVLLI